MRCLCHSSFVMSFHSGWLLWSLDQTYSGFDQKLGDREADCSSSFGIWVCPLIHVSRRIWHRLRCFDTFCSSLWLWRTRIGCCAKGSHSENCKQPIPILGRWLVMRICNILASVSRLAWKGLLTHLVSLIWGNFRCGLYLLAHPNCYRIWGHLRLPFLRQPGSQA